MDCTRAFKTLPRPCARLHAFPRSGRLELTLLLSIVAGCLSETKKPAAQPQPDAALPCPAVVAPLDSDINPYHEAFRSAPGRGVERLASALGAEVVELRHQGDYASRVAADESIWDGMESGRLYAFAGTPVVAGTSARALQEVRTQGGNAPPATWRSALNATAIHFSLSEWDPGNEPTDDPLYNTASLGAPVILPFAQMGWGYLDGGMATEIARRVLENDLTPPPEKAQTAQYMAQWQSLREQYWNNAP
jgi:hypothetical protein